MSTYVFLPDFWSHLKISSYVIVQILSFPFTPSFNPITHTPQIQVCLQTILSVPNIWFHITMHINCHRQRCNQLGHVWVTSTERIPRQFFSILKRGKVRGGFPNPPNPSKILSSTCSSVSTSPHRILPIYRGKEALELQGMTTPECFLNLESSGCFPQESSERIA